VQRLLETATGQGEVAANCEIRSPPTSRALVAGLSALGQVLAHAPRFDKSGRAALAQLNTLRGLLPICTHCKKIRDDRGDWSPLEVYVRAHSDAEFSHGLCPECLETKYPSPRGEPGPNQGH